MRPSPSLLQPSSARRRLRLVAVAVALAMAIGTGPVSAAGAPSAPIRYLDPVFEQVTTTRDLVYGSAVNDQGKTEQLELNLYQPTGDVATDRPAVVYIHGGGFVHGDKADGGPWAVDLAKRGYVVVSINYRLATTDLGRVPGQPPPPVYIQAVTNALHDAQASVRWLRANAATYGIDPTRIGATGGSAGAVTALALAYDSTDVGDSGNPGFSSAINAAVSNSGAVGTDLQGPGGSPVLMLNGTADKLATYPEATASCDAAIAAHLWCTLVTFPGVGHTVGTYEPALTRSLTATYFYDHLGIGPRRSAPPFPDSISFVARQYRDLLQRDADPVGLDYWSSLLAHGTTSPAGLVDAFAQSSELQGTVGAITRSYLAYLGRTVDAPGLAYWVDQIRAGRTIAAVNASLGASGEFQTRQTGLSDGAFVDDLYADVLARTPDATGRGYWIGRLQAGTSRAAVVAAFAPLPESVQATAPEVAVSIGTVGLLGRLPTAAERDHWVPLLRAGTPTTAFYTSILGSAEYVARITP